MSAATPASGSRASQSSQKSAPDKGLRGLMPYLRRYPGGIVFGLLVVVLMVFGTKRLPELGRSLGSGLRGFRQSLDGRDGGDKRLDQ